MYYETVKKGLSSIINFFKSSTRTNETLDKIKWIFGGNTSTNENETNKYIGSQYVQTPSKSDMWRDPWVEL